MVSKNILFCSVLLIMNYAHGMDKYPLLTRDFKTLSQQERWEYRKQLEEYRSSPEHLQHLVFNQVQLYKAAAANIEKKEKQNNGEDKKGS